jgi:hypothetical protein
VTTVGAASMAKEARKVSAALSSDAALPREAVRRLPSVAVWAYSNDAALGELIVNQVRVGKLAPNRRLLWALIQLHHHKPAREVLRRALAIYPPNKQEQVGPGVKPELLATPGKLADHLATAAIKAGGGLLELGSRTKTAPGTPLHDAVWARLLSPAASPWLASRPVSELAAFIDTTRGTVRVAYLGRALFEPLMDAGLQPGDVRGGSGAAQLAEMIHNAMPPRRHVGWRLLGKKATEALNWWRTQTELLAFFDAWDADPRRSAYWLSFVREIRDVTAFPRANALAMRIKDHWIVEFGSTNNSAFAYGVDLWERERPSPTSAREPTLKQLGGLPARRQPNRWMHKPRNGWEDNFDKRVYALTFATRDRR